MTGRSTTSPPRLLAGRTVLVTGASRGIGAATARLLGGHGAAVGVNYHSSRAAADEVVGAIRAAGSPATAVRADVADADEVQAMVESVRAELGPVDTLVLNAAGHKGAFAPRPLIESTVSELAALVDEQLRALLGPCRAALPDMIESERGCVVVVGSGMSTQPQPGMGLPSVAKAAADAVARVLALELGPLGVRVNVLAPGFVETDTSARFVPPAAREHLAKSVPLRRNAVPDDVAGAVLLLVSEYAGYLSGGRIRLSGGL
ncbi:SDR family NAD(P)-dependent oxidoreductase [Actinokineospora enzanensis]|uniref:SDR family NAD(P)-dependent oxidoreductase n=1 Tax=Actinokineospora enzanensis TaxID=155975 RepID=UPI0003A35BF2|nr:SDR family oxidoreductase [Actinokineospora enzanensis]